MAPTSVLRRCAPLAVRHYLPAIALADIAVKGVPSTSLCRPLIHELLQDPRTVEAILLRQQRAGIGVPATVRTSDLRAGLLCRGLVVHHFPSNVIL
jgi:hypothetical protein